MTQNGRVFAERTDFLELVRDIEDRRSLGRQKAEGAKENLYFLRGQNAGRFVHDQEFRVLEQTANDLDPLTFTSREITDDAVGRQGEAVVFRYLADALGQLALFRRVLHTEGDVFRDGQGVEQGKVLENHGDTSGACGAGIGRGKGCTL